MIFCAVSRAATTAQSQLSPDNWEMLVDRGGYSKRVVASVPRTCGERFEASCPPLDVRQAVFVSNVCACEGQQVTSGPSHSLRRCAGPPVRGLISVKRYEALVKTYTEHLGVYLSLTRNDLKNQVSLLGRLETKQLL